MGEGGGNGGGRLRRRGVESGSQHPERRGEYERAEETEPEPLGGQVYPGEDVQGDI
jgi:hypothetical protein